MPASDADEVSPEPGVNFDLRDSDFDYDATGIVSVQFTTKFEALLQSLTEKAVAA
jgi:hypothetical protein